MWVEDDSATLITRLWSSTRPTTSATTADPVESPRGQPPQKKVLIADTTLRPRLHNLANEKWPVRTVKCSRPSITGARQSRQHPSRESLLVRASQQRARPPPSIGRRRTRLKRTR